jgi:ABC-type maltose transport system permease subunit
MRKLLVHIALMVGAIVFSYPFIWLIAATLKPEADISGSLLQASSWSFAHYVSVFESLPVLRGFTNSLIVSGLITFSVVFSGAITGYAWSVLRWKGRDTLFHVSLLTMMMPFQLTVIPMYVLIVWLGLTDHLAGLQCAPRYHADEIGKRAHHIRTHLRGRAFHHHEVLRLDGVPAVEIADRNRHLAHFHDAAGDRPALQAVESAGERQPGLEAAGPHVAVELCNLDGFAA